MTRATHTVSAQPAQLQKLYHFVHHSWVAAQHDVALLCVELFCHAPFQSSRFEEGGDAPGQAVSAWLLATHGRNILEFFIWVFGTLEQLGLVT